MNRFGRQFVLSLAGESHGPALWLTLDGCPAGLPLAPADFAADLARRRPTRPGETARREADRLTIEGGLYEGVTTGAPLAIRIENRDFDSDTYNMTVRVPRPGHADLTARQKFGGCNDPRGGGMFSGRLTALLVAAGVVAKKCIAPLAVNAAIESVGGRADIDAAIAEAQTQEDGLGGRVGVTITNVAPGLGEPFFDSLESQLAHGLFSIPGVCGVAFGEGFAAAGMRSSAYNDAILDSAGTTATNHAGGINGGIANGNPITVSLALRPPASIPRAQRSVDLQTGDAAESRVRGRHDVCFATRVPVVAEAVCACVLADAMLVAGQLARVLPGR